MKLACDPQGRCPQCGYQNGASAQRCIRCRAVLVVPKGCSGACTACLTAAAADESREREQKRT